jgi:2-aminobenzoate-CoA ligase
MRHESHESLPGLELWPELLFTRPELQYPSTLNVATELLDVHVEGGHGARTAVLYRDDHLTYADLQRLTSRIGHALRRMGVEPGDRVAIRIPNRPAFVATWLAIQKIGAVGVATMPMLRARELAYIVNDCGVKVLIAATDLMDEIDRARPSFDHSVIVAAAPLAAGRDVAGVDCWLDDLAATAPASLDPHPTRRDDLALIAYTSGSTGAPKGTTHRPTDILAAADGYARIVLNPTPDDVFGGHPTLAFTFGLGGLLVFPLRFGAATALLDQFAPNTLLDVIARRRVSILFCAATTYRILLQDSQLEIAHDLTSLRLCVSAGETLPAAVFKEWHGRTGVEILDGLGSTEMFHVFISARAGAVRPGATGTVVPGYEAKVVDDQFREVENGKPGLLAVRGPTGCRYWQKPDRQREYVRHGWNVTGDVYIRDDDGYFWYQCRNDDLIISGGYNIAGPEVESVLLEHPAVLEAAVVASPDAVRGFVPKAFLVLKPDVPPSDDLVVELQEHVKRELAPYKYPRGIEFVSGLPRTETGKIRRVELRERERQRKAVIT